MFSSDFLNKNFFLVVVFHFKSVIFTLINFLTKFWHDKLS